MDVGDPNTPSRTTPCVYWNRERQLRVVAHVDDFLVTGPKGELLALKASLKRDYEVDGDVLSVEEGDAKQAEFLGRTISAQDWGIEIEADGRLAKGLLEEFDPESKLRAEPPGIKVGEDETPKELMAAAGAHKFRRGAAKLNYLAQDRADLSFASKEISRRMSAPAVGDEVLLTRAVRYLRKDPRCSFSVDVSSCNPSITHLASSYPT